MRRQVVLVVGLAALTALGSACGGTAQGDAPDTTRSVGPPPTIGIGGLPEPLTGDTPAPVPPAATEAPVSAPPTTAAIGDEPGDSPLEPGTVGEVAAGNRLLVIGDSILASTAARFDGLFCDVVSDEFGWSVDLHAETGQHLEFADTVIDDRLDPPGLAEFDVVAMMLGNNYRGNYDEFTQHLETLLEEFAPRPVVLYTLTEKQPDHARINEYIRWRPYFHPNVIVVDWAAHTAAEPERLLAGDGLHLSPEGRGRLVMFTAAALGPAPDVLGRPTCVEHVL